VTGDTWQALLRLLRTTGLPQHLASPF
jgi:hypothetical protein